MLGLINSEYLVSYTGNQWHPSPCADLNINKGSMNSCCQIWRWSLCNPDVSHTWIISSVLHTKCCQRNMYQWSERFCFFFFFPPSCSESLTWPLKRSRPLFRPHSRRAVQQLNARWQERDVKHAWPQNGYTNVNTLFLNVSKVKQTKHACRENVFWFSAVWTQAKSCHARLVSLSSTNTSFTPPPTLSFFLSLFSTRQTVQAKTLPGTQENGAGEWTWHTTESCLQPIVSAATKRKKKNLLQSHGVTEAITHKLKPN